MKLDLPESAGRIERNMTINIGQCRNYFLNIDASTIIICVEMVVLGNVFFLKSFLKKTVDSRIMSIGTIN